MGDQKLHFSRFVAGYQMAVAQTKQYREDISDLTHLTCDRMSQYIDNACIGFHILTAMLCPGRLGLHGPGPPSWMNGFFQANLAASYVFLGLTFWFGIHAATRSSSASCHMLTRLVRLPVPRGHMLDRARRTLSSFEEEPWSEILRIPMMSHRRTGFDDKKSNDRRCRIPSWVQKEKAHDMYGSSMPQQCKGTAPEHFEVYRELQNEWWPYDVYCRICMLLAHLHLLHAMGYLQVSHHIVETRALWAAGVAVMPLFVTQQVLLTLDIKARLPVHRIGPFGPLLAYIALALEYKREYSAWGAVTCNVLVYCVHVIHIVYSAWLMKLAEPDPDPPDAAEVSGVGWWPASWRLPRSFQHVAWLVAPPRHLEPGQVDLLAEMRSPSAPDKKRDVHSALRHQDNSPAWCMVRLALLACIFSWFWLAGGYTVDVVNQGTSHPSLLSSPGLPNWMRDPLYRPAKPGQEVPQEVGVDEEEHTEVRRLVDLVGKMREALSYVHDPREHDADLDALPILGNLGLPRRVDVQWPPLFEPHFVSEHENAFVLLSKHGRGALLSDGKAATFALGGVSGPLLAASWDDVGLLLLATTGVFNCFGRLPDPDGIWHCEGANFSFPFLSGCGAHAAAVQRTPLRAAVMVSDRVAFFQANESALFLVGEVRATGHIVAMTFGAESLFLLVRDGSVLRMHSSGALSRVSGLLSSAYTWKGLSMGTLGLALLGKSNSPRDQVLLISA